MANVQLKNPLMLAFDVDSIDQGRQILKDVGEKVGGIKVGPRLILACGGSIVQELSEIAPVFVDQKYLDIPNTMLASVRATFAAGASFCTVHAWAGEEALVKLAELEKELNQKRPFQILVVTILTSFSEQGLAPTMIKEPIDIHVRRLTMLAHDSGLSGFVCSPHEVAALKQEWPTGFFVTPGVRFEEASEGVSGDDQTRVATPKSAVSDGADVIVVGRPILQSENPVEVVERILADVL